MSKVLVVCGATGKQGGAVIDALLEDPQGRSQFSILAVTRDPNSASAKRLAGKSAAISLLKGDLNDVPSLFRSASEITKDPIWGIFSVQVVQKVENEEKQGKALIDEALKHNVKQFVYASVERGGEEKSWSNPTNVPHFASKHNIEHHLRNSVDAQSGNDKMAWTVLRPVAFMNNLEPGFGMKVFMAALRTELGSKKPLQWTSVEDVGYFGAQAFLRPEHYRCKAVGIAGDTLTISDMDGMWRRTMGVPLPETYGLLGSALLWGVKEMGAMVRWFKVEGFGVDVPALRKTHPGLLTFEQWMVTKSKFQTK